MLGAQLVFARHVQLAAVMHRHVLAADRDVGLVGFSGSVGDHHGCGATPSERTWPTICGTVMATFDLGWPPVMATASLNSNLVGDVDAGGDRLADGEQAGMGVGAVSHIGEDMWGLGERGLANPG